MNCSSTTRCLNPRISKWEDEFFCFNCFQSFKKEENETPERVNRYQCCSNPNIYFNDQHDICLNCGSIHQKITNELTYMEGDKYQTVLHKSTKVHVPYRYLKFKFPEIKYTEIYDFILNGIRLIQDQYNLKRKPYTKYVPFLYNFYRNNMRDIPEIKEFNTNKDLIIEKNIIDKLFELLNIQPTDIQITNIQANNITNKPVNDDEILKKYYYFNKSKNQYFKKKRYCQFNHCYKIANFMEGNNIKFCKEHSKHGININDLSTVTKCQFKNCKKNTKIDYCSSHKYKCIDDECETRIMKTKSYCEIHK